MGTTGGTILRHKAMMWNPDLPEGASLYHGTLRIYIEQILRDGLEPSIGRFTQSYYRRPGLTPLVFAADLENIDSCRSAIGGAIHAEFGVPEPEAYEAAAIHKYGALVRISGEPNMMCWRPDDGSWESEMHIRFAQVEPGNYFSDCVVPVADAMIGDELIDFLGRHLHGRSL